MTTVTTNEHQTTSQIEAIACLQKTSQFQFTYGKSFTLEVYKSNVVELHQVMITKA